MSPGRMGIPVWAVAALMRVIVGKIRRDTALIFLRLSEAKLSALGLHAIDGRR